MPEAIATTKRRFYQALDALNKPQPSLETSKTSPASSVNINKRSSAVAAAFDEARERARKRLRQSTSTTSLTTLDQRGSVISLPRASHSKDSRPPPNFAPWSQESFLARLKTFSSVSQWHPKPEVINEVEWAKRGWVRAMRKEANVKHAMGQEPPFSHNRGCKSLTMILQQGSMPGRGDECPFIRFFLCRS